MLLGAPAASLQVLLAAHGGHVSGPHQCQTQMLEAPVLLPAMRQGTAGPGSGQSAARQLTTPWAELVVASGRVKCTRRVMHTWLSAPAGWSPGMQAAWPGVLLWRLVWSASNVIQQRAAHGCALLRHARLFVYGSGTSRVTTDLDPSQPSSCLSSRGFWRCQGQHTNALHL